MIKMDNLIHNSMVVVECINYVCCKKESDILENILTKHAVKKKP